uniref:peptidylamidoglycolate lyase n=1 Tax=Arion vulgaris TaxID=1028688 RepID=A0A0B7AXT5_9EUPU
MVIIKSFAVSLTLFVIAYAYPYAMERWTPDEIAAYLYEIAMDQSSSPIEDIGFDTDNQGLGMVVSVDVDTNGDLFVFHRADRPWTKDTFQENNELSVEARTPISKDTIYKVNPTTGRLITSFGGNFYNVPHGITIDGNKNIWTTDVGRHQVFRFSNNSTTPNLILGEKFVPGGDDSHFCKPTDVAVASNGEFFISDGYCNSRVLKYSKDGKLIAKWGTKSVNDELTPFTLDIPHSITLVEELDLVCVADRENSRALCYNAGLGTNKKVGTFNRTLVPQDDIGKVYAIFYNKADREMIVAAGIALTPYDNAGQETFPARAYTYSLYGQEKDAWAYITPEIASDGPSIIHDLCASKDGQDYFLADIYKQKVLKYTKKYPGGIV